MPRIVDHDQRRAEIAAATLRVIARSGVRGADLRSVAAEAGCSTGIIAHYVGDKQSLLLGALREAVATVGRSMALIAQGPPGKARLVAMLEAGLPMDPDRAATCRIFYHFAAEGMSDPTIAAELAGYYDWWRRDVADVIETLQREGRFAGQDPMDLAETLVALAEGLAIQGVFSAATLDPARMRARIADALSRFDVKRQQEASRP